MAHFDDIYDIAADGYGIITAEPAREADGRLLRRGHGVCKFARRVPMPYDAYAVALVGGEAYLHGEHGLAMHGLVLVDTRAIEVATPKRVRRSPLLGGARDRAKGERTTPYEGIPSQRVADVIESCVGSVVPARLLEAAKQVRGESLITASEYERLERELA